MSEKKETPWQTFRKRLTSATQAVLSGEGRAAADPEWEAFRETLSGPAKAKLDSLGPPPDDPEIAIPEKKQRYFLVEVWAGEYPVIRGFSEPKVLAKHLGELEGKDVAVVPFWGTYLPLSVGPQRLLALPDRLSLLTIPRGGIGVPQRVDIDTVNFEVQEQGYLGPAALITPKAAAEAIAPAAAVEEAPAEEEDEVIDET